MGCVDITVPRDSKKGGLDTLGVEGADDGGSGVGVENVI